MGKIQKEGKWVPHELCERDIKRRLTTCEILLEIFKNKSFLHRIITGDKKNGRITIIQSAKSRGLTQANHQHRHQNPMFQGFKVMLSIGWDQKGVLFY